MTRTLTAAVHPEDDWFVARCLELDVASQGEALDEAVANLREAVELYLEQVSQPQIDDSTLSTEIKERLDHEPDVYVSPATIWEVAIKQSIGNRNTTSPSWPPDVHQFHEPFGAVRCTTHATSQRPTRSDACRTPSRTRARSGQLLTS
jgi:predicted RNase H-like HicB family nuclease